MSAVYVELDWEERLSEGDNPSVEQHYTVRGTADRGEARFALKAACPVLDTSLPVTLVRQAIDLERVDGAEELWHGVVKYARKARPETGQSEWSFDTSGVPVHTPASNEGAGWWAR